MNEQNEFLLASFIQLEKDFNIAFTENDFEKEQYTLLRVFKLLNRIETLVEQTMKSSNHHQAMKLYQLTDKIKVSLGKWYAANAYKNEMFGDFQKSESCWLAAISYHMDADYYIQYAHITLRNKGLLVNKEINENMEIITVHNVREIRICLKRARVALKSALDINKDKKVETIRYLLGWIDLIEKEINNNKILVDTLSLPIKEISFNEIIEEFHKKIGMEVVKRKVKEISDWVTFSKLRRENGLKADDISLHMILIGNPGTGKTTVARTLAKIYKALGVLKKGHLVEVTRAELVAEYVGQTAIKTKKKIEEARHGVLFIDEAYSLSRGNGNDFGIEAIDTITKEMEDMRGELVVILAGYPKEMEKFIQSNPGLNSRFKFQIDFPDYTVEQLMQIHHLLLKEKQYKLTRKAEFILQRLIEKAVRENPNSHGNGRLIRNIIEEEILSKASLIVEQKQNDMLIQELDIIDETVMRRVQMAWSGERDRNNIVKNQMSI
ncbi:AAA family ATPase [Psychrobacillus sp. NPDC093180]|uniref:AAA family ATPase n=1 Tax=Psychrobacillus sp. NPDC093180 TaxID=3364489 RepID=UPI00380D3763